MCSMFCGGKKAMFSCLFFGFSPKGSPFNIAYFSTVTGSIHVLLKGSESGQHCMEQKQVEQCGITVYSSSLKYFRKIPDQTDSVSNYWKHPCTVGQATKVMGKFKYSPSVLKYIFNLVF